MFKYTLLSLLLILSVTSNSFAQTDTDEQLAAQYFMNKEYDKAVLLYEKLYANKQDYLMYSAYLECLIKLKEFNKAEKIIRKQVKAHPLIPQYGVDMGYLYLSQKKTQDAKTRFESLIKNATGEKQYTIDLANAFLNRGETDYAVKTYLKVRKATPGLYPYNLELAEIYEVQQEYVKMMDEYISLLEYSESYKTRVEGLLQDIIAEETDNKKSTALKNVLLIRIKDNPDKTFYSEMLLWYSIQIKDFATALVQAKALDRRMKEDGKGVLDIARLASSNGFYDVAVSGYQYIIDKGKDNYYYINSKSEILDVKYLKITTSLKYTKQELVALETDYIEALTELGKSSSTISVMKNLAHIEAFYLDSTAKATKLLYEALEIKNAGAAILAECKIELADILLLSGEVWEATLLYSQVEKAFKNEPVGHQAKLKNAKLSFYIGEFEWAKAQLDVLKAATSKLIANDAMALSLLINDNSDLDSTYYALAVYSRASLLFFRNKYDDALNTLDSVFVKFNYHAIFDEVYYKKAEIYIKKGISDSAVVYYKKIMTDYSYDILGDDATYKLALMYEEVYADQQKAMDTYEKLMTNYPGSSFVVDARKRFRALRGDSLN